jgi:hypothetical protein
MIVFFFQTFDQLTNIKDKLAEEPVSEISEITPMICGAHYKEIRTMFTSLLAGTVGIQYIYTQGIVS